jgi:hypothetical protein
MTGLAIGLVLGGALVGVAQAEGPVRVMQRSKAFFVDSGEVTGGSVSCPKWAPVRLGGGFGIDPRLEITASAPQVGGAAWNAGVTNRTDKDGLVLRVFVSCARF